MKSYQHINLIFVREMFFFPFSYIYQEHCINNICSCKLFETNYNITKNSYNLRYITTVANLYVQMTFAAMYSVKLYIMVKIENFPKQSRQTHPKRKKVENLLYHLTQIQIN